MATQNRNQASATARQAARVNQLNSLGSQRAEFDTADVFNTIELVAADFITKVKTNIQNEPDLTVTTGEIENVHLVTGGDRIDIIIPNHLIFQSEGVRGNSDSSLAPSSRFTYRNLMPPVRVFENLIRTRNIQLAYEPRYGGSPSAYANLTDGQKIKKAAWGMAKNIQKVGFKGHPDIYQNLIPGLITDLQQAVTNHTVNFLTQIIRNNDGTQSPIPII